MGMGSFCSRNHFFIGSIQPSVTDILHNRSLKQPCVLKHHTKAFSKLASVKFPDIVPIHFDAPAVHIIKAHQKLYHRRFPCTGRPYNSYCLPGFYLAAEILDNDFLRLVTESYMVEMDSALYFIQVDRILGTDVFFLFI